jgi:hypothetical protein
VPTTYVDEFQPVTTISRHDEEIDELAHVEFNAPLVGSENSSATVNGVRKQPPR